jgi:hypothetical protein
VLLSQVHRLRALVLLARFLDMGPWAVELALSVGIFPYVLKLLQTTSSDLRNTLVFIWAKILALDRSCQARRSGTRRRRRRRLFAFGFVGGGAQLPACRLAPRHSHTPSHAHPPARSHARTQPPPPPHHPRVPLTRTYGRRWT